MVESSKKLMAALWAGHEAVKLDQTGPIKMKYYDLTDRVNLNLKSSPYFKGLPPLTGQVVKDWFDTGASEQLLSRLVQAKVYAEPNLIVIIDEVLFASSRVPGVKIREILSITGLDGDTVIGAGDPDKASSSRFALAGDPGIGAGDEIDAIDKTDTPDMDSPAGDPATGAGDPDE
jgi:hypothetical protein